MKRKTIFLHLLVVFLIALFPVQDVQASKLTDARQGEVKEALERIFEQRSEIIVTHDKGRLENEYTSDPAGQEAFRHELRRMQYMNAWAEHRALKLTKSKSHIRIIRVNVDGDFARVSLVQSHKISYMYMNRILPEQDFGVGTRHAITLKKLGGAWKISKEWYLDPLDENPKLIAVSPDGQAPSVRRSSSTLTSGERYNRKRAVQYANLYAGAAWGAGNKHHYNNKYKDYTDKGGDCTNFASQVLGDPEAGGGLAMREGWRYFAGAGGTKTWVQTDALRHFLSRSGYAKLVAKGKYEQITTPTKQHPDGALALLKPGDLIGYVLHNDDTDHFSIVVGYDDNGYPLVNSHTADRYRVPFDLGWDRNTVYQLFHIQD
ncbi:MULTISPECIES: amidase domain-containing protein [unclassified Paenibacillus]|uniref:amidase domain-containing protein n=1 Tax=unclassified Paenibacillus TaxID=185978 RepID=UPI002404F43C|nr:MULTISPECIES: amidase domain-containing protein [unclassified Paenibacillus]MDF9842630.1 hypothetical protein [Paenibacillus sp. PastF-2]MDF9849163.1 hypothetical protein [Paenibacillus sp. PastM-2]MDF9855791.1 hypothetical protein [Paenibacillus sp. PastF-1]MDH6481005.1 hypothetical protein [Paenibacillus sp. PastH-2]MDH6508482.1 hypothetical protein [Paenibacillus sp. PastM-3]